MPLILNAPPVRVELTTQGEWVDLKSRLSKGDQARIQAAAFKVQIAMTAMRAGDGDISLDYEASVFAGLEVGIIGWSFAEPLTPANIRGLDPDDYALISARANELWQPRSDDEAKNSSASGATPSGEKAESPPSSNG